MPSLSRLERDSTGQLYTTRVYPARLRQQRYYVVNNDGHLIVVREVKEEKGDYWLRGLNGGSVTGCLVSVALARRRVFRGKGKITKKWFHIGLTCPITGTYCRDHECLKLLLGGKRSEKAKLCEEKIIAKDGSKAGSFNGERANIIFSR